MAINGSRDGIEAGLASLQTHDAGALRIERIRARCLVALEAQQRRANGRGPLGRSCRRWLEPAAAFALSALYLTAAVGSSLALFR